MRHGDKLGKKLPTYYNESVENRIHGQNFRQSEINLKSLKEVQKVILDQKRSMSNKKGTTFRGGTFESPSKINNLLGSLTDFNDNRIVVNNASGANGKS
jgi:hypothetical protein